MHIKCFHFIKISFNYKVLWKFSYLYAIICIHLKYRILRCQIWISSEEIQMIISFFLIHVPSNLCLNFESILSVILMKIKRFNYIKNIFQSIFGCSGPVEIVFWNRSEEIRIIISFILIHVTTYFYLNLKAYWLQFLMTIKKKKSIILERFLNQSLDVQDMLKLYVLIRSEDIQIIIPFFLNHVPTHFFLDFESILTVVFNDN